MTEIPVNVLQFDLEKIARDWMLITAGTKEGGFNTMTASWGHLGSIWGHAKDSFGGLSSVVYIRQSRYTKEFVDREPLYTLSFFPKELQSKLAYLGSHSGRDGDKVAAVGFTPVFGRGWTGFAEAELTLVCRKLYHAPFDPKGFADEATFRDYYGDGDVHELYIGEIIAAYQG